MSFKKNGRQIKLRELLTDIAYAWNLVHIKCYHPQGFYSVRKNVQHFAGRDN